MSPPPVVIYHNPRCTKSRETLALLQAHGVNPQVVEYLQTPLRAAELKVLIGKLGIEPHGLLRTKEAAYRELNLSPKSSLDTITAAIAQEPILMERPVVVVGDQAVLGRPPENVLALLPR
jgi:arsenate reductase